MSDYKLGKHLGVVQDPRTIAAASVMTPGDVKVPSSHRIAHNLHTVPMFANNRLGDCTQASKGHAIMAFENSSGQKDIQLDEVDIIVAYERIGGYDPANAAATDNGAYEIDSLNDWRTNGIGRQKDGTPHKIGAFVKVDHTNFDEVKLAHYVFGGLKVCLALPTSAEGETGHGDWYATYDAPGSWGGHSTYSYGYDSARAYIYTWGKEQSMTWGFWNRYVDEVYAVISPDYLRHSGKTPQGFDVNALNAQLAKLS